MERSANYTLVGLFTILATAGLGAFLIWLAGAQFAHRFDVYDIAFHGPVRGLSVGGEVYFNGIRVGEVTRLSLDKDDPDRVSARIRITAETPVRIVSRASLEPQGVTGASYVQISAGDRKSPFLRGTVPEGQIPVIQASRSPFETLLAGGGDVLTRTVEVLDRVNRLISDDNVAEVSASIRDVHFLTTELKASGGVIANVQSAANSITANSDKFGALADQQAVLGQYFHHSASN